MNKVSIGKKLIKSLRKMNREPEKLYQDRLNLIKCLAAPFKMPYQCDKCGQETNYLSNAHNSSYIANIIDLKSFTSRGLIPISVNSDGLCRKCGKGRTKANRMEMSCIHCNNKILWELDSTKDAEMAANLIAYLLHKKTAIHRIESTWRKKGFIKGLRDQAKYYHDHILCQECQKRVKI